MFARPSRENPPGLGVTDQGIDAACNSDRKRRKSEPAQLQRCPRFTRGRVFHFIRSPNVCVHRPPTTGAPLELFMMAIVTRTAGRGKGHAAFARILRQNAATPGGRRTMLAVESNGPFQQHRSRSKGPSRM